MASTVLHLGYLVPVGKQDLSADDLQANRQQDPGSYGFMIDDFGPKLFRYGQNRQGAGFVQGMFVARDGDSAGHTVVTACVGTTTSFSATSTTYGLPSQRVGSWVYVRLNNDVAGGAPEGEVSVCVSNTSQKVTVDTARPFSTPLALSDAIELVGNWNLRIATSDTAFAVFGCCVADNGIADTNFGWFQTWGYDPICLFSSSSTSIIGVPLVCASTTDGGRCKGATGATQLKEVIGMCVHSQTARTGGYTGPALIQLDFGMQTGTTSAVA